MNLKNIAHLSLFCLTSWSCGGSSSDSFTRISDAVPANLTHSQKNALNTLGASVGSSSTDAASSTTTNALARAATSNQYPATQNYSGEDFESQTFNCAVSGSVTTSGSYDGNFASRENGSFTIEIEADISTSAENCVHENGSFDGELSSRMSLVMDIRIHQEGNELLSSGQIESLIEIDGDIHAQGKNEEDEFKDVEISYNKFKIRTLFDPSDSEAYAGFSSLYDDSANEDQQLEFLRDKLECSGSISIDGTEYGCASVLAKILQPEDS